MKILFFTNEYSHPDLPAHGGVGTFFKTMADALVKLGHDVSIYGFSKKKYHVIDGDIEIVFFKQYFKKFPLIELARSLSSSLGNKKLETYFISRERKYLTKKLKSFAQKKEIDIIQSFTFNGFTAYWDNSIPLVTRFHGSRGFWHYYLNQKEETIKILMEKKALQVTPYTVANSHFSATFIKEYYNVDVNITIPNGINTQVFSPDYSIKEIPKSIFYVGTISEAKGLKNLALMFNEIVESNPTAELHLLGRGEKYLETLKTSVFTKNAVEKITHYGHVPFLKIPKKLMKASVIVVPTLGETFGFTIVEAMALEKVTIVSNIPVAKEIITTGEDGLIAKNNSEFKSLILDVFNNPMKYEPMQKKAREKVLNNFTNEIMIEKSLKYYTEILSKKIQ